ncbi:MAG: FG-GAP-like repeat-containing protein [Rhodobacteraceae bacterium]|nr:FG-GAP-like repeat-containing protein [Paracoccaceae bacterium]
MHRVFVSVVVVLALTAGAHGDSAARQGAVAMSDAELDAVLARFAGDLLIDEAMLPKPAPQALIDLGAELFFSKTLSGNLDTACASCHHPFLAGADGLSLPVGESAVDPDRLGPGRRHDAQASKDRKADGAPNLPRHTPTIFNTGLLETTLFTDGRLFVLDGYPGGGAGPSQRTPDSIFAQADPNAGLDLLATQARFPVISPQEMAGFGALAGATNDAVRDALAARLKDYAETEAGAGWVPRFEAAFGMGVGPTATDAITFPNIQKALSAYQSSKLTVDAPWFDYVRGAADALNPEAKEGARLFFAAPGDGGAGCVHCHAPPLFTDEGFHNIAVPQFGRGIQADGADYGRRHVTQMEADRYRFRTPSLLNIAMTAPYGHTGAFLTLERMIAHHIDPAGSIAEFDFSFADNPQLAPFAARYAASPRLTEDALSALERAWETGTSALPRDLALGDRDVRALAAFLETLTDPCMEDRACLSRWLPKGAPPDAHRLEATFGAFDTDHGTQTPEAVPVDGRLARSGRVADSALTDVPATLSIQCATAPPSPGSGSAGFDEVGLDVGLSGRHALSWSLYSARHAQRVLFTGGIAVGDVNGDCLPDIYLPTGDTTPDKLYLNQPSGRFTDVSEAWGLTEREFSNGVTLVDLDGDGTLDAVVTNIVHPDLPSIAGREVGPEAAEHPTVYRNVGNERFELWPDAGFTAIGTSWSIAFGDYDLDGDLDGVSTHWRGAGIGGAPPNHLWRQDQTENGPVFVPADADSGLADFTGKSDFTFTSIFSDVDLDGAPDLLVAADFENSEVFANSGLGTFNRRTDRTVISDENGMGAAVADYDNDGDLDWFVTSVWDPDGVAEGNWGVSGNKLYRNDGGAFAEIAGAAGVTEGYWGWGACFADFKNDSWPDLFHATGFDLLPEMAPALGGPRVYHQLKRIMAEFEKTPSLLFMSNRDGTFTERAAELGVTDRDSGRAVVCFDYDRDGDIDILVSNHQGRPLLYRNNFRGHPESNFVSIRLAAPDANSRAVGAKVFVTANGVRQFQEMRAGGGFLASAPYELHFGVGDAAQIDRVEVQWPGRDRVQSIFEKVRANMFYTIERADTGPSSELARDRNPM